MPLALPSRRRKGSTLCLCWASATCPVRPHWPNGKCHNCATKKLHTETSRPATSPQMLCGATLVKCPQGSNSFVLEPVSLWLLNTSLAPRYPRNAFLNSLAIRVLQYGSHR